MRYRGQVFYCAEQRDRLLIGWAFVRAGLTQRLAVTEPGLAPYKPRGLSCNERTVASW